LKSLDASVDWRATFQQAAGPEATPIPPQDRRSSACLRIQVIESGRPEVDITFRARAATFLHELLPGDLGPKLTARGIDIRTIEKEVVNSGFAPGELFSLSEDEKRIRVWLE
jgi:hypothetical protein